MPATFSAIISGVLLGISFNYPVVWFLSLFALIPFLHLLHKKEVGLTKVFFLGWLFGLVFIGIVHTWVWNSLPLDWLGIESELFGAMSIFLVWLPISFVLSFFIGVWAIVSCRLLQEVERWSFLQGPKQQAVVVPFFLASLWVLFEYLRMWGAVFYTWGGGSTFGAHYSVGFVGYILAENHNLLQLAGIGGVYLLSFVVISINGILYWFFFQSHFQLKKKRVIFVSGLIIFLIFISLPFDIWIDRNSKNSPPIHVALIQVQFPSILQFTQEESTKRFRSLVALIEQIAERKNVDIIVFPEDSRFLKILERRGGLSALQGVFEDNEVLVIDTGRVKLGALLVSARLMYYNTLGETITYQQDKRYLVPHGEYTPYLYAQLFKALSHKDILANIKTNREYTSGVSSVGSARFKNVQVGALFCSEILSPSLYSQATKGGANILVNTSASSWFHGSKVLYNQIVNMAKVRAVENNRYFMRSANMDSAFAVDNRGRLIAEAPWGETGVIYTEVYGIKKHSIYNRFFARLF